MAVATAVSTKTLTFTRTIQAPVSQVYESFANRDNLSDWLCYDASLRVEVGGHAFFRWYEGNHAYGVFSEVEENKKLAFSWQDGSESGVTLVDVTLDDKGNNTLLALSHSGFEDESTAEPYRETWDRNLDKLQSILETGANIDITERVIIGITPTTFDENVAERLGVPVAEGARIGGVVPGFSAEAAGMQADDVIVQVDDTTISPDANVYSVTRNKKPGDEVEVSYYRGSEKHNVTVALKGYPIPEIPPNFTALADSYEKLFATLDAELSEMLSGISEEAAGNKPDGAEWSVKEGIARVILGQRHNIEWLASYLQGPRIITPYTRNRGWITAIVAAHPTVSDLLDEMRRTWAETVALVRTFPPELEERKNNLWWIAFESGGFDPQFIVPITLRPVQNALDAMKS